METEPDRPLRRLADSVTAAIPNSVVRWAAARGAPMARLSGRTSIGSAALAQALATLAHPPVRLWSRSSTGSVDEVADRVGRDPHDVRRWQAAGMLGEESDGQLDRSAFDRAALIDLALRSGADEDALAAAAQNDNLVWAALESVLTAGGPLTGAQAAESAGVSLDTLTSLWRALGLPTGGVAAAGFDRRDVQALRTVAALQTLFSDEDLSEAASVIGRAMTEVSTTMVDLFTRRLAEPLLDAGGTETDVVVRLAAMRDLLVPTLAPLLEVALERHVSWATRAELTLRMEQLLEPGTGHRTLSVGFADLVGFTTVSETLSASEVRTMAGRLHRLAETVVSDHGGRITKSIGDAVMFTTVTPGQAAACGVDLVEDVAADDVLPPVRVGISHGPVLPGYADYFGRTVNLASRLCTDAQAGEVLLAADPAVLQAVDWGAAGLAATSHDVGPLKGIDDPVSAVAVTRA